MNPRLDEPTLRYLIEEIERTEALQSEKVVDLARRLKPGITGDDLKNPHDFPELADTDWHYADGQLAGYQSVLMLLRNLQRRAS